ncbi:hypothetical protein [Xanthocytophaga flava]|uniref:hypothetical protein n=1 Tax=Xanthocytophaga flava TaxID=3048013 RepID=UPI0028D785B7|nr:hypothetical protein [Xanthocytophaga flavus]MDJ1470210.1 hypothetical protein [Xanthocytophaga flavus]
MEIVNQVQQILADKATYNQIPFLIDTCAGMLEVGTVLYTSYGYEQTNIDFYKVTKMGKKFFEAMRLPRENTYTGDMCGKAIALDSNQGKIVKGYWKSKCDGDRVFESIKVDGIYASRWDGKPKYFSSYA